MRVLLDENLPRALAAELTGQRASGVQAEGWSGTKNEELLSVRSSYSGRISPEILAHPENSLGRTVEARHEAVS